MMEQAFKIMLIEDNPADARLTLEAFKRARGVNTFELYEDGESALAALRDEHHALPDLVLLDLNLPGMDGREVLQQIKADPKLRTLPVCVLTTSRAEHDIVNAYSDHTNCYIVKPVDLNDFRTVIAQVESFWFGVARIPNRSSARRNS